MQENNLIQLEIIPQSSQEAVRLVSQWLDDYKSGRLSVEDLSRLAKDLFAQYTVKDNHDQDKEFYEIVTGLSDLDSYKTDFPESVTQVIADSAAFCQKKLQSSV